MTLGLGQVVAPEQIVSLKNTSGADRLKGTVVILKNVAGEFALPAGDATDHWYGVLTHDCKVNDFGDVAVGPCRVPVIASAALATPGAKLMATSAGKSATWAAGAGTNRAVLGSVLTVASGADVLHEVFLAAPDTVHQG